jgi:hypothetical protein
LRAIPTCPKHARVKLAPFRAARSICRSGWSHSRPADGSAEHPSAIPRCPSFFPSVRPDSKPPETYASLPGAIVSWTGLLRATISLVLASAARHPPASGRDSPRARGNRPQGKLDVIWRDARLGGKIVKSVMDGAGSVDSVAARCVRCGSRRQLGEVLCSPSLGNPPNRNDPTSSTAAGVGLSTAESGSLCG